MRLKFGAPPRGGYVKTPSGMSVWSGHDCEIEAGPAIVTTLCGEPNEIVNCLFPDGTRGKAAISLEHRLYFDENGDNPFAKNPVWKRRGVDGRYVFGTVEITAADAVFTDRPDLKRTLKDNVDGLERDLMADAAVREDVKDDAFAERLYDTIAAVDWVKGSETWSCSARYAGGLVADLRDRNESYTEFYPGSGRGGTHEDVLAHLARLGWTPREEQE